MYIIDGLKLKKGDVILSKCDDDVSKIIREKTKSNYSHAAIYMGEYSIIESTGFGVHSNNIQRILYQKEDDVVVLRFHGLTEKEFFSINITVRQQIGTSYSIKEALKVIDSKKKKSLEPNRQFCSRLVAQAFDNAGIKVVDNINYCSPEDLLQSQIFSKIHNVLKKPSEAEISFASGKTILNDQTQITKEYLEKVRDVTKSDLQDFNQINLFLGNNPHFDNILSELLINSGYLELWKYNLKKNPAYYNYDILLKQYPNSKERFFFAENYSKICKDLHNQHSISLAAMKHLYNQVPLNYYLLLINLYKNLIELSDMIQNVVDQVFLERNK